jgi:hypothetical protein
LFLEKEYIKISDYAKRMSLHMRTVYRYFHEGKLEGFQDESTKSIFIKNPFREDKPKEKVDGLVRVALYARVSSSENRKNLESQMERLRGYAAAKGYLVVQEIQEVGSGLNDGRKKLNKILDNPTNFDVLLVEHKDRLTRFGFIYIELLLQNANKRVEVINEVSGDKEDLIQDFVSVITSFCARIYGRRRSQRITEKMIQELKEQNESVAPKSVSRQENAP